MTDAQAISFLIGDPNNVQFSLTQVNEVILMTNVYGATTTGPKNIGIAATSFGSGERYLACELLLRSWANSVAGSLQEVKIGDYQVSQSKQVAALNAQADSFHKLYVETPAWAIIETNESDLNALIIIRNYVLRSNP